MTEKVEIRRGLTTRSLVVGIVLVIAMTLYENFMWYTHPFPVNTNFTPSYWWTLSIWWMFWAAGLWFFFVPLLVFVLLPERIRLTSNELAVIFAMMIVTYPLINKVGGNLRTPAHVMNGGPSGWTADEPFNQMVKWIAPWHCSTVPFNPDGSVNRALFSYINGGWQGRPLSVAVPVPWGAFMPGLIFGFFEIMLVILMGLFISALIRKQYVEIEALPFPNATAATTLINEATTKPEGVSGWFATKPKLLSNKWLWIGFLVAQVFLIPSWLGMLLPFSGVSTTPYEVYTAAAKNLIIPFIPIAVVFTSPWALGFGLLMPIEALISWFITWIVFIVILTNVQWMAGIFPPPPETASMDWFNGRAVDYYFLKVDPAGQGLCAWSMGILIVAAFYPMWVHRKHVVATIKAMWTPSPELESGDIPYKWYWLGLIGSFIGYLALAAVPEYAGYSIRSFLWMPALSMILFMITWIGASRMRAETGAYGGFWAGGYYSYYRYPNHWWNRIALANVLGGEPKPEGCVTGYNMQYFWTFNFCHGNFQNELPPYAIPMPTMLEAFKIGHETKTRPYELLIAVIIALIVAYWVANPFTLWIRFTANWTEDNRPKWTGSHDWYTGGIASRGAPIGWRAYWYMGYGSPAGPDVTNTLIQYVIGAVLGIVLFWLRAKFPAFIYNPLTIPMWGFFTQCSDVFLMFLLALVIKYLVVRTYGVLFYEQKLIPLAIGLILGGAFHFTIDDILFTAFRRTFA